MPKEVELNKLYKLDARLINTLVTEPIIDVTITSPPYFDLKDYGYKEQIGYGQNYDQYLDDLHNVFSSIFSSTKDTGTLWVVIDAFRKNGQTIPLPFDFANKIKDIGWQLQEIIIWGKDKTVPWAHKGQMRNSFEYILMFSKTEKYKFDVDKIRDYEALKKWWVKYPERYNPRGKTPEAIWNFDIPVQGSWGSGDIRHYCPLPEDLIAQILKLTTTEGDVVLDPFSGTGAVLAKADNMKRKYIGTELNDEYIEMFNNFILKTENEKRQEYEIGEKNLLDQNTFEQLILDLRALKFARVLYQKLKTLDFHEINLIYVEKTNDAPQKTHSLIVVKYVILLTEPDRLNEITNAIQEIILKAPLSKFGIECQFEFIDDLNEFLLNLNDKRLYLYTSKSTHKFKKEINLTEIPTLTSPNIILSEISVDLNEQDYA